MKTRAALLMIVPAVAFFLLSFVGPLILVGRLSFFETDYVKSVYVGLVNFGKSFKDAYFLKSFVNVGWFVLGISPASIAISYGITSFLHDLPKRPEVRRAWLVPIQEFFNGKISAEEVLDRFEAEANRVLAE